MAGPINNEMKRNYIAVALHKDDMEAEHLGTETIDGKELEVLRVKGDVTITFLLDPETALPARARYTETNPQTGQRNKAETVFSEWTVVDGVAYAYKAITYVDGEEAAEMKVESHSVEN